MTKNDLDDDHPERVIAYVAAATLVVIFIVVFSYVILVPF